MESKIKRNEYNIEFLEKYKPPTDNEALSEDEKSDLEKKVEGAESKVSKKTGYAIIPNFTKDYSVKKATALYENEIIKYISRRQESLNDFSDRVPGKFVHVFPETVMGGVLGFTYLGENFIGLRADLVGKTKKMVDIHESIHTPDEYETRILTDWIMSKSNSKYIK